MSDRYEILGIALRLVAAASLSFLSVRYMVKHLDPSYAAKEENKKKVAKLFEELGIEHSVDLDEHELKIAMQLVSSEDDGASWDEIGGYGDLVNELQDRIILPLRLASQTTNNLLYPPKGVLLYGPPGCGKTLLAKALARAAKCRFINLQVSNLTDKWYGESQKLAAAVFSVAAKFQPTIIFIDEIDSFLRDRQSHDHEATAMMKAQFMTLWDGFASTNDQIIVIGATNRPGDVDTAILRRLPAKFKVDLPNRYQRLEILKVILKNHDTSAITLDSIASSSEGLSGSDLKEVCRIAVVNRAKLSLNASGRLDDFAKIEEQDLASAIQKYRRDLMMMSDHLLD
ncbi:unnamed protein product [Auanema sp. JU1783]|nr:unnamed protein product [Auanema sp. JU1783]